MAFDNLGIAGRNRVCVHLLDIIGSLRLFTLLASPSLHYTPTVPTRSILRITALPFPHCTPTASCEESNTTERYYILNEVSDVHSAGTSIPTILHTTLTYFCSMSFTLTCGVGFLVPTVSPKPHSPQVSVLSPYVEPCISPSGALPLAPSSSAITGISAISCVSAVSGISTISCAP